MSLDTLTAEGAQVVARAEVWLDGALVEEPKIVDGKVAFDATSRVIRTCEVELLGQIPTDAGDPLAPIGSEIRLYRGARDWTGEIFESPLGRYAFDSSGVERRDRTVSISGGDYATLISDARWEGPYLISGGTNLAVAISNLIQSRLSANLWQTPNLESTTATVPTTVLGEEVDNDPMDDARGLARADGLEVAFDRSGRLTVTSVPDPTSEALEVRWRFLAGVTPNYVTGAKELTGRPYNVVVARGETEGDTAPVEAVAEDDDPASASYIGRYRRPYFLASSYIADTGQALRAARGELNRHVGLSEVVAMTVVPHPDLDVWQIIEAHDPELGVDARYLIDRVEIPLLPGEAKLTTRRRRL